MALILTGKTGLGFRAMVFLAQIVVGGEHYTKGG
jgi:hypothetical protein